jgi:hypothetical protein
MHGNPEAVVKNQAHQSYYQMNKTLPSPLRTAGFLLLVLLLAGGSARGSSAWKSDPGAPDSIWIPTVDWRGDTLFALDIYAATDDSLAAAQIVIAWSNPAIRFDSAKFNVGRWAVPGYHRCTQAGTDTAVAIAFISAANRLPPGSGLVGRLFFGRDSAYAFDSDVPFDTVAIVAAPPLAPYRVVLSDIASDPFLPTVVETGTIVFSPCICTQHGDIVDDGEPNAMDLSGMIDGLFANGPLPPKDPDCPHQHRGDYNCDNNYDALDLSRLIDYLFAGGIGPCDPCSDL